MGVHDAASLPITAPPSNGSQSVHLSRRPPQTQMIAPNWLPHQQPVTCQTLGVNPCKVLPPLACAVEGLHMHASCAALATWPKGTTPPAEHCSTSHVVVEPGCVSSSFHRTGTVAPPPPHNSTQQLSFPQQSRNYPSKVRQRRQADFPSQSGPATCAKGPHPQQGAAPGGATR